MRTRRQSLLFSLLLAIPAFAVAADAPTPGQKGTASAPWLDLPGLAEGCDGIVRALLPLPDGRIVVGGSFSSCRGVAVANVAIWQPATGAFAALGGGIGAGQAPVVASASALALIGDGLVVGGSFAQAGGVDARNIARYDFVGGTWSTLGAPGAEGVDGDVLALAVVGTDLYAGGAFVGAGSTSARHIARFDQATQTWSAPAATPNGPVRALAAAGTGLIVGGDFTAAGTLAASRIARFDTATSTWSALGAGVDGTVHAIVVRGDTIFLGGAERPAEEDRVAAGGAAANLLAAYDLAGGSWSALARNAGQGLGGGSLFLRSVRALALAEGELLATGDFTLADGRLARHLARVDPRTRAWQPLGADAAEGMDGPGLAIAVSGRQAFVGGGYRRAGGVARAGLAALLAPEGLFTDGFEPALGR